MSTAAIDISRGSRDWVAVTRELGPAFAARAAALDARLANLKM